MSGFNALGCRSGRIHLRFDALNSHTHGALITITVHLARGACSGDLYYTVYASITSATKTCDVLQESIEFTHLVATPST
jgi:hypothetical protein